VPILKNARHEAFALGLFEGKSQEQAYVEAGYSKTGARQSASKLLLTNPDISDRVKELEGKVASSAVWTKADALNKLAALHNMFAATGEPAAGSVARAALMDYAKLSGWVIDKNVSATVPIGDLLDEIND
jgi:hypothetical protein